jgi:hypothetical protein
MRLQDDIPVCGKVASTDYSTNEEAQMWLDFSGDTRVAQCIAQVAQMASVPPALASQSTAQISCASHLYSVEAIAAN